MEAWANSSNLPDVSLHLSMLTFNPRDPPPPPTTKFYCSTVVAKNVSSIYRVVESNGQFQCYPEAQSWPQLVFSSQGELQNSFTLLEDDQIFCSKPDFERDPGQVRFPDLEELRLDWQVGSTVYFRHCDVRTPGIVVGKFVWHMLGDRNAGPLAVEKTLRLVLLLQLPTNELLLSSQVTDLERPQQVEDKEEVYIQGISLIGVVATLISNVAYLATVAPIRGTEPTPNHHGAATASRFAIPTIFLFLNAFAFYTSVLAVVLMTAFIPIYGTAGQWGGIFLSGSLPVVLSLVAFYVAYMVSAWSVLDAWGKPLGITIVGILMVVYVRFWAIELMCGNVERTLHIRSRYSPWEWFYHRLEEERSASSQEVHTSCSSTTAPAKISKVQLGSRSAAAAAAAAVRRFFFSPTMWQLYLLGTLPKIIKPDKRTTELLKHLQNNAQ